MRANSEGNGAVGERDWPAERFETDRGRLRAVAYRMLGSLSEADDAVQEAWLPLARTDASTIENLSGWLTTVVGRVSLDMLRSRKSRREDSLDVHVPDPIVTPAGWPPWSCRSPPVELGVTRSLISPAGTAPSSRHGQICVPLSLRYER